MHQQTSDVPRWTLFHKVGFRFVFVFFSLIIFPFPFNTIPGLANLLAPYQRMWGNVIKWVGGTVFNLSDNLTFVVTGSGDKVYDWLWYVVALSLAVLISSVWSVLDRKRPNYIGLRRWLVLFVSYYVMYFMLVYGIIKVFYLQFRPPALEVLYQTYGHSSPMRLLWTFLGSSKSYTVFAGVCETIAGLLLIFRQTRTLGGLVTAAVMLNVFLLNMSYDVPVKLFSFQLILLGIYIAAQDWKRIWLFLFNRPVPQQLRSPLIQHKVGNGILLFSQAGLVLFILIFQISGSLEGQKQYGEKRELSPLYGAYEADLFVQNGDTLAPLVTDSIRWRYLILDYVDQASIFTMNESLFRFASQIDTLSQTITFSAHQTPFRRDILSYIPKQEGLHVQGVFEGDTVQVTFTRHGPEDLNLLSRGFRWVNERPYNRYQFE